MKIFRITRGFTTNSSGSYEWLPGGMYASSTATGTPPVSNTLPTTSIPTLPLSQYRFSPAGQKIGGILLILVGLVSGVATAIMVMREFWGKKKR
ncbi:MAG: hypothetical protein PHI63_02100 [Patescibacteria group bacterium]|nr:hypothetical protein [Patescibacteria group bacterium]